MDMKGPMVRWKIMGAPSMKWIALCLLHLTNFVNSQEINTHACDRECMAGAPPMWCSFDFHVQWFESMSKACFDCPYNLTDCFRPHCIPLDGIERSIMTVNKILPGPLIQACEGDMVEIVVHNHLPEETTSIHWHGLHQRESPYMDGVPFVTQCPIMPKSRFKYLFQAATPGTHFWHSHSGSQRGDGMFGALIIRRPKSEDRHGLLYDHDLPEHIMTITDWHHKTGTTTFLEHHHSDGDNKPNNILVNGKGRFTRNTTDVPDAASKTPLAIFNVRKGEKYRFRLINAGFLNCPIEMSIDNHSLTVINSDGGDIEPEEAISLVSYAGERWDFILHPQGDEKNYWIRFRGLMDCDERFTSAFQAAILHYEGAVNPSLQEPEGKVNYNNSHNAGVQINPLNEGSGNEKTLNIPELISMEPVLEEDKTLQESADITHYLAYDFYPIDNPHYHKQSLYGFNSVTKKKRVQTPQINHISMRLPSIPLLSQRDEIKKDTFCEPHKVQNCSREYCECTHVIHIPYSSVVELILVDEGFAYDANHPFHLHGYPFRVVAMERVGKNVTVPQIQAMDRAGLIKRNLETAPLKDTVTVPDGGYTIIRFHATNPGYWLFHCHIEFHVEMGMAVIFKIGEDENMPPVPHGFPKCGDYLPSSQEELAMYKMFNSTITKDQHTHLKNPKETSQSTTTNSDVLTPTHNSSDHSEQTTSSSSSGTLVSQSHPTRAETSTDDIDKLRSTIEAIQTSTPSSSPTRNLPTLPNQESLNKNQNNEEDKSETEIQGIKFNDISSILQLLQGNIIKTEYKYNQKEPELEETTMYNLLEENDPKQSNFNKKFPEVSRGPPQKTSLDELHFAFIPIRIRNPIAIDKISRRKNTSDTENEIGTTLLTVGKNYLTSNQMQSGTSTLICNAGLIMTSLMITNMIIYFR